MPWLVFTNLYVATCGASLTAASYALLGLPIRIDAVVGIVFFSTLVIYNLDRLVEPRPGDSEHERWVESHRRILWGVTISSTIAAFLFTTRLRSTSLASLSIAGGIAMGYCLPVIRFRRRWCRLKALPGAKLALITFVWTYATLGLPLIETGVALNASIWMVLMARLFFIAAVALPFDLPDIERDRRSGVATLPTLIGIGATRSVAFALIAASALLSLFIPWAGASALFISCLCVGGLLTILRPDRGVLYFMVALDGMLIVQAGLLWCSAGPS